MPQLLAVEWDNSEARLAVASARGDRVTVEHAFAVKFPARQTEGEDAPVDVGEQIAAALHARGISRGDTLLAVSRSSVELRQLSVPPCPDEELPELVRFQAMREFNELNEAWPLDFVPMDSAAEGPRSVLAAAINPDLVAQIQNICHTAGLKPHWLILRPCAAASLLDRAQPAERAKVRLLVDLLSEEADLTVMVDGQAVFLRTTRLVDDPLAGPEHATPLLAEIRRTIAAAHNQLGDRRVESIVLCGRGERQTVLATLIQENLGTATTLFDPFGGLTLSRELQETLPDRPARFAPLLGMLVDELQRSRHAIDFLHPRRRPPPANRRKFYIAAGVAAGLLVLGYFGYVRWERNWLETEITLQDARSKALDKRVAEANKVEKKYKEIDKWAGGDICWLDELRHLSTEFPSNKEIRLTKMEIGPYGTGGEIKFQGLGSSSSAIQKMEDSLRDKSHRVLSRGSTAVGMKKDPIYSWQFTESVFVSPEKP